VLFTLLLLLIAIRSEHERHSPQCPFVKGEFTQNVPLSGRSQLRKICIYLSLPEHWFDHMWLARSVSKVGSIGSDMGWILQWLYMRLVACIELTRMTQEN